VDEVQNVLHSFVLSGTIRMAYGGRCKRQVRYVYHLQKGIVIIFSHQIVTFGHIEHFPKHIESADIDAIQAATAISKCCSFSNKLFRNMYGGTHPVSIDVIKKLIDQVGIVHNDVFLEIGCGEPRLAFALSSVSQGGLVISLDLGKFNIDCNQSSLS
jgi:hypothetical protein